MSSLSTIPVPAGNLARKAWMRLVGLLLLGLAGASSLGFYSHRLNRLDNAVAAYQLATLQYQTRNLALENIHEMEEIFDLYLLSGAPGTLHMMDHPRNIIEQLAHQQVEGRSDPILQALANEEKSWYEQTVMPMAEARRKIPAGQPLPEHFLDAFLPVNTIGVSFASDIAQHQATAAIHQAQMQQRWLWLPYPVAGLLGIGVVWLTVGAFKNVSHLKQAAENKGEEEGNGGKELQPADPKEATK